MVADILFVLKNVASIVKTPFYPFAMKDLFLLVADLLKYNVSLRVRFHVVAVRRELHRRGVADAPSLPLSPRRSHAATAGDHSHLLHFASSPPSRRPIPVLLDAAAGASRSRDGGCLRCRHSPLLLRPSRVCQGRRGLCAADARLHSPPLHHGPERGGACRVVSLLRLVLPTLPHRTSVPTVSSSKWRRLWIP